MKSQNKNFVIHDSKNSLTINNDFTYFDKEISPNWNNTSIEYLHKFSKIALISRIHRAYKFDQWANQYELEAYPVINKKMYSFLHLGISDDQGLFPKNNIAAHIYRSVSRSTEVELGLKNLHFSNQFTWLLVGGLTHYYRNWIFTNKYYFLPSQSNNETSISSHLSCKNITNSENNDYIEIFGGYGLSAQEMNLIYQLQQVKSLTAYKIGAGIQHKIHKSQSIRSEISWTNQETPRNTNLNLFNIQIGLIQTF